MRLSSTFSSSTEDRSALGKRREAHSLLAVLGAAVLILVLCELGARVLAAGLPEPGGWHVRELERQVARMQARAASEPTCLAFVGSSAAGAAIDPAAVTSTFGRDDWYVAWVAGANARVLDPWTREMVVGTFSPGYVAIAITSFELNDGFGTDGLLRAYLDSPGRREAIGEVTVRDRIEGAASDVSALVAMRSYLRSPGEVAARLSGRLPAMAPPHGEQDAERGSTYGGEEAENFVRGWVQHYAVGGPQSRALERLIEALQQQGIHVALVDLPVLEERWAALHEHGRADLAAYRERLQSVAASHDVPLFSYAGQLQDRALYADPIHLNGEGSARFSRALAPDLAEWIDANGGWCTPDSEPAAPSRADAGG